MKWHIHTSCLLGMNTTAEIFSLQALQNPASQAQCCVHIHIVSEMMHWPWPLVIYHTRWLPCHFVYCCDAAVLCVLLKNIAVLTCSVLKIDAKDKCVHTQPEPVSFFLQWGQATHASPELSYIHNNIMYNIYIVYIVTYINVIITTIPEPAFHAPTMANNYFVMFVYRPKIANYTKIWYCGRRTICILPHTPHLYDRVSSTVLQHNAEHRTSYMPSALEYHSRQKPC